MVEVLFWGKPDCAANDKQQRTLEAAGHKVVRNDLVAEPFTPETLRPFFGEAAVEDWFNRLHPAIKSGQVDRHAVSADEALGLMVKDRDMIRRPLLQVGEVKSFGFDPVKLQAWIGIQPSKDGLSCDDRHAQGRCDHGHL